MKEFNTIIYDVNKRKFEAYDIMPYLIDEYKTTKKKDRPKTFDECKEFIKKWSMYRWWARCQYEIIIVDWPNQSHSEKWDIHKQVMMNLDTITEVFMDNLNVKCQLCYE